MARLGRSPGSGTWRPVRLALWCLALVLAALGATGARPADVPAPAAAVQGTALVLSLDGIVGPASADYLVRSLESARDRQAAVVVLRMDTPGGLDTSMREIIRAILSSPVPVLTFVSPSGARAASAGTYILYASHVAAMAPGTNLGAATPIALGGGFPPAPGKDQEDGKEGGKEGGKPSPERDASPTAPKSTSEAKAINDAVAYIRSLAELRGRDPAWAEEAVRMASSLPAREALSRNVIDLVAEDIPDLLAQAHGRTVKMGAGSVSLETRGLALQPLEPDWRTRALAVITNPNLALILLLIGVYGLIFEFMSPGSLYPGVIGAISLVVGLYALSALPLTYAGLALIVLGIGLMVAEIFTPSIGILGIGGATSFVLGSLLLVDTDAPAYEVSLPLVAGVAVASLGMTALIARLALKSRRAPVAGGTEVLLGRRVRVLDWAGGAGHVLATGERWQAEGAEGLRPGQMVTVRAVRGLTLEVAADEVRSAHGPPDAGP